MARYLILATYSVEGSKGVAASGMVARREAVKAGFESMGGTLVSMEVVLGGSWDFAITCELPDGAAAKAMMVATMATGGFRDGSIVELISAEAFDAARPAGLGGYRPPNA